MKAAKDKAAKDKGPQPGQSYTDWYAEKMDRRIAKDPDRFYEPWRQYQLHYLQTHGLTETSELLDYGCGPCGAGVFMIEFLEPDRYTGADISSACIQRARDYLQSKGLMDKRPNLAHLPGGDLAPLRERGFDIIWAQSVLTHMPPDEVRQLMGEIPALLREDGGTFLATFRLTPDETHQAEAKNFCYTAEFFDAACPASGLKHSILRDYSHPSPKAATLLDREYAVLQLAK
jgi:cyclopropane fatty-acyl-phospholipid synthase-like methyltransferase